MIDYYHVFHIFSTFLCSFVARRHLRGHQMRLINEINFKSMRQLHWVKYIYLLPKAKHVTNTISAI